MGTNVCFSSLFACLLACLALTLQPLYPPPADQEFLHRTSLENQKLSLMGEVSYLKVKLADMEGKQSLGVDRQHKAEVRAFIYFFLLLEESCCLISLFGSYHRFYIGNFMK